MKYGENSKFTFEDKDIIPNAEEHEYELEIELSMV